MHNQRGGHRGSIRILPYAFAGGAPAIIIRCGLSSDIIEEFVV